MQQEEDTALKNLENLRKEKANGVIDLEKTTIERRFILEGIAIQAFNAPELQVKGLAAFDRVKITDKVDLQRSNFQSVGNKPGYLARNKSSYKYFQNDFSRLEFAWFCKRFSRVIE